MSQLWSPTRYSRSQVAGVAGATLGVMSTLYLLFAWKPVLLAGGASGVTTASDVRRQIPATETETAYCGVVNVLVTGASADPALLLRPLAVGGLAVVGGASALRSWSAGVWISTPGLVAFSVLGVMSIGLFVASPTAALLLSGAFLLVDGRTAGSEAERGGPASDGRDPTDLRWQFLVSRDVLAVFLLLGGPITVIQVAEIDVALISVLALPGYLPLLTLSWLVSVAGSEGFVGSAGFYALNVAWTYFLSLGLVAVARYAISAVTE